VSKANNQVVELLFGAGIIGIPSLDEFLQQLGFLLLGHPFVLLAAQKIERINI
jgi:hypothetical protein